MKYLKLGYNFNKSISLNYIHQNLLETSKPELIKASINHISIEHLYATFEKIKSIQNYFKTKIKLELIQYALHPSRLEYSLSCSNSNDINDVIDCY